MAQHSVDVTLIVVEKPDFAIVGAPTSQQIALGETAFFQITLSPLFGFVGDVGLTVLNLPVGMVAIFHPETIHVDGVDAVADLEVRVLEDSSMVGTHQLTVEAISA